MPRAAPLLRAFALAACLAASHLPCAARAAPPSVILVTVDGVRTEEVFAGLDAARGAGERGEPLLPKLHAATAAAGFLAGDELRGDAFGVRNGGWCSLPGYQALLAGRDLGCRDNRCGRVRAETLLERARRELGLAAREVAVFGSWPAIALAAERRAGSVTVNVGVTPFRAPFAGPDDQAAALDRAQAIDLPPWGHRRDRYTWDQAMRYLDRFHPRLLWIALGDPDEWAHLDDYPAYARSVQDLDERLAELLERLAAMGEYGAATSVLVTTDHGRGRGDDWTSHGLAHPGSGDAWLFAVTPASRAAPGGWGGGRYDHLSVRPTIEALLGLAPCPECREPIGELLPRPGLARRDGSEPRLGSGGP